MPEAMHPIPNKWASNTQIEDQHRIVWAVTYMGWDVWCVGKGAGRKAERVLMCRRCNAGGINQ